MTLGRADETIARPASFGLPPITDITRAIVARADSRRLALLGDQQVLRARYEEIMQWLNPPWDAISRRVDPRPEQASSERGGLNKLHVDLVNPATDRWAVLQAGAPFVFRCKPPYVESPIDDADHPDETIVNRKRYDLDRQIAQNVSTRIETKVDEWVNENNFGRTLLWAVWAKEAFGKSILRVSWDSEAKIPTAELMENPSTCYYGWDRRYGRRKLAWLSVVEELSVLEANRRWGLNMPIDPMTGALSLASWTGMLDQGDMDTRDEQSSSNQQFVTAMEYHELSPDPADGKVKAMCATILAGRIVEGPVWYPWSLLPFKVLENQHIPTWQHGKSTAETMIPLNEALDDLLARQHEVIEFESGPRYKGINMGSTDDEVDIPPPFTMLPLREGVDIQQIDTRVDFFPSELHSNQLYEGIHRSTGLTPIGWGMSPNAQTSGRAMSAEWRAVEIPLTGKLVNLGPEVRELIVLWWDLASAYDPATKKMGNFEGEPYRQFEVLWIPLDIRDKTEQTLDIIQRLQANILDPETAIEESGKQNVDEIMSRIKAYMVDPIYNPLRYQQLLTLQQLELTIRQQEMDVAAQEQQMQGQQAPVEGAAPGDLQQQGTVAAGQAAQGPAGPVTEAQNQPGQSPGNGGLPMDVSTLLQTPLEGGVANRIISHPGGAPVPTTGNQPQ